MIRLSLQMVKLVLGLVLLTWVQVVNASPEHVKHYLKIDGLERSFYLYQPEANVETKKPALVMVLHGGGRGDGETPSKYFGFNQLADKHGFIVVYPNGVDAFWRDGRGYTHRGKSQGQVDDVSFIRQLIDHLALNFSIDISKVYLTGISNGGMMSFRLACEIPQYFAAIAPIASNMPLNIVATCKPENFVPMLIMNGTDDPLVPYYGGSVGYKNKTMGEVVSTYDSVNFWVNHNQCNLNSKAFALPDINKKDKSTVSVEHYTNLDSTCDVWLYRVEGGGHTIPGSNIPNLPRLLGRKNMDFSGAEHVWRFFERH
ncbi:PHB depolymerase family esterase [Vibrio sp. SCSIO 43136]|uniref:alpha/beta hydrolase family esterase n=1 Tax=Vibrio sp. SCSIO 43136 TaxID=2819101 RepID=UPI002075C35B|nr:PHB depolymerase family esterase [Vibrio sp. SCSIO 43136]USD64039.1 prolyl oligopeptidase family serine peptidase [Vibrio sp. SCSIO 43136]